MSEIIKNPNIILATDCGSTTTKAILIEFIDNEYRLTHRGEAPTTVEAPFEDVTKGVLNSLVLIRTNFDVEITYLLFLSIWTCDTFAFFLGSKFGKRKIFPKISPNKTWFGSISGFLFTIIFIFLVSISGFITKDVLEFNIVNILLMAIIFGIISQVGDAIESMIKREIGIKDSGSILQVHGGMLDRMDSLILASPFFYIFLKIVT